MFSPAPPDKQELAAAQLARAPLSRRTFAVMSGVTISIGTLLVWIYSGYAGRTKYLSPEKKEVPEPPSWNISEVRVSLVQSTIQSVRREVKQPNEAPDNFDSPISVQFAKPLRVSSRFFLEIQAIGGQRQSAYIYVLSRSRFSDGHLGEQVVIFPKRKASGDNNTLEMGRAVLVPDHRKSHDNYFAFEQSGDETEAILTVYISPEIDPDVPLTWPQVRQTLPGKLISDWEGGGRRAAI